MLNMHKPKHILLISGKRKCGKDYIAEMLLQRLGGKASILRISEPLKSQYAKEHNLDHKELMTDGPYKEVHRRAMIEWSDLMRAQQPGYFCEIACNNAPKCDIWIVSDIRRQTDITWFKEKFEEIIKSVRIIADQSVRQERGWKFSQGVDDVTSECDLDNFANWDLIVTNNANASYGKNIETILKLIGE